MAYHKFKWLKMKQVYYFTVVWRLKSEMGLTGLKSRRGQGCFLSGVPKGKHVSWSFLSSEVTCIPYFMIPSSICRARNVSVAFLSFFLSQPFPLFLSLFLLLSDLCFQDHILYHSNSSAFLL